MLSSYSLYLYSLITDSIETLFIGLWWFCVHFAVKRKCRFKSLINFLCGHLLSSFVFARTFYEIIYCFFRCLSPSIKLEMPSLLLALSRSAS